MFSSAATVVGVSHVFHLQFSCQSDVTQLVWFEFWRWTLRFKHLVIFAPKMLLGIFITNAPFPSYSVRSHT